MRYLSKTKQGGCIGKPKPNWYSHILAVFESQRLEHPQPYLDDRNREDDRVQSLDANIWIHQDEFPAQWNSRLVSWRWFSRPLWQWLFVDHQTWCFCFFVCFCVMCSVLGWELFLRNNEGETSKNTIRFRWWRTSEMIPMSRRWFPYADGTDVLFCLAKNCTTLRGVVVVAVVVICAVKSNTSAELMPTQTKIDNALAALGFIASICNLLRAFSLYLILFVSQHRYRSFVSSFGWRRWSMVLAPNIVRTSYDRCYLPTRIFSNFSLINSILW